MSDRKLLELAAKALGWIDYPGDSVEQGAYWHTCPAEAPFGPRIRKSSWDPLANDGEAFRIAVALKFCVETNSAGGVIVWAAGPSGRVMHAGAIADDPLSAARRTIVCAAAFVGAETERKEQIDAGIAAADGGQLTDIDLVKKRWLERRPVAKVNPAKP